MKPTTSVHPHRLRRTLLLVLALAAGSVAGWYAIVRWRAPSPVTYTTAAVERGQVVQAVTAAGTVKPVVQVQVGSQVSGRIKELLVDYNDHVTAGQVIARIDPSVFESQVAQARARLVSARADVTRTRALVVNAKAQHARAVASLAAGLVPQSDVDTAVAELRSQQAQATSAEASVTEAQATLDLARSNLAYTTITSPIDGVVISRSVDVGQTVAASLSAPTLFVIAGDLRAMEVHTSVAESDVGQITAGMKVRFTVDAFPEETFTGTVAQVRNEATTVSNVVTYDAVVKVANDKLELRPSMTANVTFVVAERTDVLTVPSKALRYRPAGARAPAAARGGASGTGRGSGGAGERRAAVWVLRDGAPVRVAVQAGLTDGSVTEITGGELAEGDAVITADSTAKTANGQGSAANRNRMPRGAF